jgi:hypothetical protein
MGGLTQVKVKSRGGLKWEKLFGRPLDSDISRAYGLVDNPAPKNNSQRSSLLSGLKSSAKQFAKSAIIQPVLYNRMRIGLNLVADSIKPKVR